MNPVITAQHILGDIGKYSKNAITNALNTYGNTQMQGVQGYQDTQALPLAQQIAQRNADPRIQAMNNQNVMGAMGNGTKLVRIGDKLVDISTLTADQLAAREFGLNLAKAKSAPLIQVSPRQMIRDALAEAVK